MIESYLARIRTSLSHFSTKCRQIFQRKVGLAESEERFRLLVEAVKDYAIFMLDPNGYITTWNSGAERIKGYTAKDIIGQHFSRFYTEEALKDDFPAKELRVASLEGRFEDEGWRIRKDGSRFWANVIITSIRDENDKLFGFSKVTRDMTALKKFNEDLEARVLERTEELRKAKLAAEAANEAKSSFLANMSHEIRTPLGAVLGFSELLISSKVSASDKVKYWASIQRNGVLLSNIINDILDLSKVEAGKLEIDRRETSINEVLTDIASLLRLRATEKGVDLNVILEGEIPDTIFTDALRLRQVLINIVGNAIKFTERGSVDLRIWHSTLEAKSTLAFEVRDTGAGISPNQLSQLFQPFSQVDSSFRRKFGGTGLGLVLSRHLARLLGGDVTLMSTEIDQGSSFLITIDPGTIRSSKVSANLFKEQYKNLSPIHMPEKEVSLKGVKVLVVDDSPDNQVLVAKYLKMAGAEVDTAENGRRALEKAEHTHYDIFLMDLQMPVMDGYEATSILRKKGCLSPIIALTAHALKEERIHCLNSGFDEHISKPINRHTLLENIAQFELSR